jgi:fibronectin-binding autotransporter adhesin
MAPTPYTGGTTILAGNLIVASDSSLGAAVPAGATVDPNNVKASVQAANGIIFNSLTEGNGTLTLGTTPGNGAAFSIARPIAVDGETATTNITGHPTTLTG